MINLCIKAKDPKKKLNEIRDAVVELRKLIDEYPELRSKQESVINLCIKAKDPIALAKDYIKLTEKMKRMADYQRRYYVENREHLLASQAKWRNKIREHYMETMGYKTAFENGTRIVSIEPDVDTEIMQGEIKASILKGLTIAERQIIIEFMENECEVNDFLLPGMDKEQTLAVTNVIINKLRKNRELEEIYKTLEE